ncbi:YjbF family lipoprotein [Thioclava sp. FR2]|uniref:YjbF family lipoprotein n=1 Tax=Thioclava sp. FR2 TaxID=3445780 RepID=UPI003EBE2B84
MKKAIIALITGATVLSACGNDTDAFAMAQVAKAVVPIRAQKSDGGLGLTRAALQDILSPVQLITLEERNQQALVGEIEQNGGVETWSSVDKVTISLRNGVLVATRGLGDDLMSASGQRPNVQVSADGTYARSYVHLNGLDQTRRLVLTCSARSNGAKSIEIVEKIYSVTEIEETCSLDGQSVTNSYWIDSAGKIRKSRQWVSPNAGSVVIEDLRG